MPAWFFDLVTWWLALFGVTDWDRIKLGILIIAAGTFLLCLRAVGSIILALFALFVEGLARRG